MAVFNAAARLFPLTVSATATEEFLWRVEVGLAGGGGGGGGAAGGGGPTGTGGGAGADIGGWGGGRGAAGGGWGAGGGGPGAGGGGAEETRCWTLFWPSHWSRKHSNFSMR